MTYYSADENGLLVVGINENIEFDGYKGNPRQNEAKILKNVFKKGDAYFNSGDLFSLDKDYFVYFKDRTGDTFRFVFYTCKVIGAELNFSISGNSYEIYISNNILFLFRWKGENVSTFEVGSTISQLPWVHDANVYGVQVPGIIFTKKFLDLSLKLQVMNQSFTEISFL